jgi:hypothetical protein
MIHVLSSSALTVDHIKVPCSINKEHPDDFALFTPHFITVPYLQSFSSQSLHLLFNSIDHIMVPCSIKKETYLYTRASSSSALTVDHIKVPVSINEHPDDRPCCVYQEGGAPRQTFYRQSLYMCFPAVHSRSITYRYPAV